MNNKFVRLRHLAELRASAEFDDLSEEQQDEIENEIFDLEDEIEEAGNTRTKQDPY